MRGAWCAVRVGVCAFAPHPFTIDANRFGFQVNTTLTDLGIAHWQSEPLTNMRFDQPEMPLMGVEGQTALVAALQVRLQRSSWWCMRGGVLL